MGRNARNVLPPGGLLLDNEFDGRWLRRTHGDPQMRISIFATSKGADSRAGCCAAGVFRQSRSLAQFLVILHLVAGADFAAETVVAHSRNGQILTGVVDERTTARRLWLRLAAPNIVALGSVDWRDVKWIEAQGRNYSAEEFRPEAMRLKSTIPDNVFAKIVAQRDQSVDNDRRDRAQRRRIWPQVQSLRIEADLANWDRDAEVDGLEVRVYPQAADRSVVPVSGMLTAQLFGQNITPDEMFEPAREDYSRLERWSVRLARLDFAGEELSGHEAVIRLPFRRIHPEFEVDVRNFGQLNASLAVDGQGVHDATVPVILRSYSPVRERLQQYRRDRFLPGERRGNFPGQHIGVFPGDVTGQ
jgi:hypothetical protein